jgi:catechol 2,3-dioxygenase-like lactoylglutathione lyase family enzyme
VTVQRLSHLGICVTDLDRSLAFYRDGLGFREVSALDVSGREASTLLEIPGVRLRAIYLERDGARIELLHYPNTAPTSDAPLPMNRPGLTHLSFRVSDLDAALKAIQSAGGSILPHTRIDTPRFHAHAAFALDPDGTRIELVQSPGNPDTLPGQ